MPKKQKSLTKKEIQGLPALITVAQAARVVDKHVSTIHHHINVMPEWKNRVWVKRSGVFLIRKKAILDWYGLTPTKCPKCGYEM